MDSNISRTAGAPKRQQTAATQLRVRAKYEAAPGLHRKNKGHQRNTISRQKGYGAYLAEMSAGLVPPHTIKAIQRVLDDPNAVLPKEDEKWLDWLLRMAAEWGPSLIKTVPEVLALL
jgi:hypothetical protein